MRDSNTDSTVQQMQCKHCGGELVLTGVELGDRLRCAICSNYFLMGKARVQGVVDRGSAWSLYLGLSSVLLLCFTGIPALYLGIRSLLRMRHESPSRREKISAMIGTVLGTVFGVFGGFCLIGSGGFALIFWLTWEDTDDPQRIREMTSEVVRIEIPEVLQPVRGITVFNALTKLQYADSPESESRNNLLLIQHLKPMMNSNSHKVELDYDEKVVGSKESFEPIDRKDPNWQEPLEWVVDGKSQTVYKISRYRKQVDGVAENEREVSITYNTIVANDLGRFGIVFAVRRPQSRLTESQIEDVFGSVVIRFVQ